MPPDEFTPPEIEIRRYNPGEEDATWQVYFAATRESVARDYHPDLIERWAPHDRDMDEWSARIRKMNPFVAAAGNTIIAFAEIEESGFIDYFYVHPKWQGRGVGTAMLARVECEAARLEASRLFANVSVTAKTFFQSQGFKIVKAQSKIILGHPAPNFVMEKRLDHAEPDKGIDER